MAQALGLLILSFFLTSILLVPFIDLLYKLKLRKRDAKGMDAFSQATPIYNKLHAYKVGVPIGAGLLIIAVTTILTLWSYGLLGLKAKPWELFVLLFAFISFGALGLYDDIRKTFGYNKSGFFGLRLRHKLAIQTLLAFIISIIFFWKLGFDFIYIHWLGRLDIGFLFIPLAVFIIVAFANAFNITDGLDGLSAGLALICLLAFWVIASQLLDPTLAVFLAVWIGALIAFLYFNIFPARVLLGDTGALAFGATLAVVGLLTGKITALAVVGGVFVIEAASSLIQLLSKKYRGKKFFTVAPIHLYFQHRGWEEPKVVMRFWLAGIMFAVLGLWIAMIK
ncbi:MAG: phospho-N-acetylmuramoyl-pentapeptide-transferase [bacterium]|nr:phospho-N-acetylmuramoyl-pentapeptide-transferase [bacterium]